jgi:thioredoxin-like negative regulator of GroEL
MGRERIIRRTCRSCGNPHEGPPLELVEGAQCRHCKAVIKALTEPLEVDKGMLDSVASSLPVPVLVDIQMPGTPEQRAQSLQMERVARKLEGRGLIVSLDAEDHREVAWDLGVQSAPTLLILKKYSIIFTWEGFADAPLVEEWMRIAYRMP